MSSSGGGIALSNLTSTASPGPSGVAVIQAVGAIFIMLTGVLGNGTIIAVIVRTRSLRNITGVFLVNLAVADLSVALWTLPFIVDTAVTGWWRFGEAWCQACGFLEVLFTSASVSTLALISYDRYVAIVKPLHYQQCMTATRATVYLVCIWGVSVTCACLPMTSIASYVYIEDIGACTVDWEKSNWGYTVAKYFVGFCLPLAMILFCYAKIYIVARRVKRQIRPAPANLGGPEHTSRWANEKSQCDALTGEVSQASPRKRQPGARVDRPSTSLPDNMRYHGNSDQVYRAKITDTNGSTLSEGQREPRAAKADIKRSKSAQHVWRGDLVNGTHSDKGLANVKCSVPAGLAIVPSIFQNDANVPTIRTDDYVPPKHKTVQKRFSLNEGALRNKREKGKHKSSTSGESGEWKTFTSKQTARKVAKLKKMQSIRDTKAATTLLILLGVFLLCWIPYVAVCFLLNAQVHVNARVHCAAFMVALTNSVLNVFVYGVLNTKFRMGFRKLWKPCCLWISCRCLKRRNTDPGLRIRSISHSLRNNGVISERAVNGK